MFLVDKIKLATIKEAVRCEGLFFVPTIWRQETAIHDTNAAKVVRISVRLWDQLALEPPIRAERPSTLPMAFTNCPSLLHSRTPSVIRAHISRAHIMCWRLPHKTERAFNLPASAQIAPHPCHHSLTLKQTAQLPSSFPSIRLNDGWPNCEKPYPADCIPHDTSRILHMHKMPFRNDQSHRKSLLSRNPGPTSLDRRFRHFGSPSRLASPTEELTIG